MATKQHSNTKKSRKRVLTMSERSAWAAHMHGADPEWLHTREARNLAIVFKGCFPAWLIESEPWHKPTPIGFRFYRTTLFGLSTEQCAAFLGVHRATINKWENGMIPVPKTAYEVMRLLGRNAAQRLSHRHWDGWFINRQTGELVSPDHKRLSVKPAEINLIPNLYGRISLLELEKEKQAAEIAFLQAENTALRTGDRSRETAIELEAMQARIADLLTTIRTAQVFEFKAPANQHSKTA